LLQKILEAKPSSEDLAKLVDELAPEELELLLYDWKLWARDDQLPPGGDWIIWLILAGRGWGKTRTGAEFIRNAVCGITPMARGNYHRLALVGATAAEVRDVMVEGESGILATSHKDFRPTYLKSLRKLEWPNGAVAICFSAEDPDQLRGPQQDLAWADELAKWQYADDAWSNLMFGLRLGDQPRAIVTTTPRPIKLIRELLKEDTTHLTKGTTYDNSANLAKTFIKQVISKYEGTRLGRQELLADILDDNPYALWRRDNLDQHRSKWAEEEILRTVVAVDPPVKTGEDADECGIVVASKTKSGRYYVHADYSEQGLSPEGWAAKVVKAYNDHSADRVVAEVNQGGAMVESVLRAVDANLPYKAVHASKGKVVRAEPIAALYEQGKVSHVGSLAKLEDQMCEFTSDFDRGIMGYSPDRVDALVWALTALSGGQENEPRIRSL
jgi:phage terminase large subunit-like protein